MTSELRADVLKTVDGNTAPSVTPVGGVAGTVGGGMIRLGSVEWTTDTAFHDFDVIDSTKYINYFLYWYISHQNTANSGDQWSVTALRFKNGSGDISSGYDNNCTWTPSGQTTETINSGSYAGAQSQMWMAGNGSTYDSQGFAQITIPNSSSFRACIRGNSQLIGTPRQSTAVGNNYREDFASVHLSQDPTAITGVRITSWSGSGYTSQFGSVQIYGLEK